LQIIKRLDLIAHKRPRSLVAILFIDLDRFKIINESLGHQFGDRLLILVCQRIQNCLRPQDRLARVGGDEFVIILEQIDNLDLAVAIAKSLQVELTLPFELNEQTIVITASLGITFSLIERQTRPEELLRDAHTAMYRAKDLGKNRCEIFTQGMHLAAMKRLQLENDLRQAIKLQEFELYYQPIVDLQTDLLCGFEALVRWNSPQRGLVTPGEFIPLAEETGLIIPLGFWILQTACRQIHDWYRQFPELQLLTISVNLSSHQFVSSDLVEQIERILRGSELDYQCLKLEITESAVMENIDRAIEIFRQLKSLGIKLSIDDFGTGHSSLSYLHYFAADTLKIDRSFVKQMELSDKNGEIIETIIMLAHKLGMDVIAEGIETITQLQALQNFECEYGQGYLFSKPLKNTAATQLLAKTYFVRSSKL
jgi:diguanylate cyclase (GGDEF)-like protein